MVTVTTYTDIVAYYKKVEPFLLIKEAINNLPLGILKEKTGDGYKDGELYLVLEDNGNVAMVIVQTFNNLILSGDEKYAIEAMDYLIKSKHHIKGLIGEPKLVQNCIHHLAYKTQQKFILKVNQRIYKIEKVNPIQLSPGTFDLLKEDDLLLASKWIMDFHHFIEEPLSKEKSEEVALKAIKEQSLFGWWQNNRLVSIAKKVRPSKNGVVINTVYTPPEFRSQGFGSSCVWSLTSLLLKEFTFCSLYTDLANPTSNSIYMKIGYIPLEDSIVMEIV